MFCEKCGKRLTENAKFCSRCGAKVNQPPKSNSKPLHLKRYSYNSGTFGFAIFQLVLCLILIIADIVILCFAGSWHIPSDRRTMLIVIFWFALIVNLILLILKIANLSAISKTFLCVTEKGIIGVGGTPSYFSNENVKLRYRDITMVTAKTGMVVVSTVMKNYKFLVENNDIATGEILYYLEKYKKKEK